MTTSDELWQAIAPRPLRGLTEGDRAILREQEADARPTQQEAMNELTSQGGCPSCWGTGEIMTGWAGGAPFYEECPDCEGTGTADLDEEA